MWQLGIEMRPFFSATGIFIYPLYAGIGASFGYWLKGVEDRQNNILRQRKELLLEKRKRRAEREAAEGNGGSETVGILSATS